MSANEIEFKMEDGNFRISTNSVYDADKFKMKIANLETQKINFEMQLGFYDSEIKRLEEGIEEAKKGIEANKNNIGFVNADLDKAYKFLEENDQSTLIEQIKVEVEVRKKKMLEQAQQQAGGLPPVEEPVQESKEPQGPEPTEE